MPAARAGRPMRPISRVGRMADILRQIIAQNRAGQAVAIPSVCTAHGDVIAASLLLAQSLGQPVVVEATSNQVNQMGGYTGMQPADFVGFVQGIASDAGVDPNTLILGGDHLGPQVWRKLPADQAMRHAVDLVAAYARAGFTKLHLDCSEGCAGEPAQLPDAITAQRSATLAKAALVAAPTPPRLLFVIGTEVPPPGGARADEGGDIPATTPAAAAATLSAHRAAFDAAGIGPSVAQIGGLVVQPGVEFSPTKVHHLPMSRDPALLGALDGWPQVCLEAHSTDYQHPAVYPRLAQLGFAFQKVGPALTFAYRAALYDLDALRRAMGAQHGPSLPDVMESVMLDAPAQWQGHYTAKTGDLRQLWHFGLADRIRYYWPAPKAREAVAQLFADIAALAPSDAALAPYFSDAEIAFARQSLQKPPQTLGRALAMARVQSALRPYFLPPSQPARISHARQ